MSRTESGGGQPRLVQAVADNRAGSHAVVGDASPQRPSSSSVSEESLDSASSSSDGEEDDNPILRKLPAFLKKQNNSSSDDDGGEEEPAFLPFSTGDGSPSTGVSGTVTLRGARRASGAGRKGKDSANENEDDATAASPSPRVDPLKRNSKSSWATGSPRRAVADSAGPSSPSMGSSFSDLSGTVSSVIAF